MACLSIKSKLNSVVLVGEFCGWDIDKAVRYDRKKGSKNINIQNMPKGEYKVLCCESFDCGEIYPTDGRKMRENRYFSGEANETICCFFA